MKMLFVFVLSSTAAAAQSPVGFAEPTGWAIPSSSSIESLATGAFDSDGDLDVVAASTRNAALWTCLGDGAGRVALGTTLSNGSSGPAGSTSVIAADMDGDGVLDAVTANGRAPSRSASILLGNGAGNLGAPLTPPAGAQAWSVDVADVYGDTQSGCRVFRRCARCRASRPAATAHRGTSRSTRACRSRA